MLALAAACNVFAMMNFYCFSRAGQGQGQGLLEVCLNSPSWVAVPTLYCAGTAPDPWPPSPPPRLLMQAI